MADYNPDKDRLMLMNIHLPNSDDNPGAVLTLVRLLGKTGDSESEFEEAHYSDWTPKKAKFPGALQRRTTVVSGPPSVVFVQGVEPSGKNRWTNLPIALFASTFFIYAMPTLVEVFASHRFSPWISTILPGDIIGCLWLATAFRMRLMGLLLYVFLTASESGLYTSGMVDAASLTWLTDLVPALFVAGVMAARSRRGFA
jgi:hypothetical protein